MRLNKSSSQRAFKKIEEQIIKKHLDVIILKALKKEPMSGYDIILFVHSEYGVLLGAGIVYNLLHSLEKKKLIKAKYTKRAKCYVLDLAGEDVLEVIVDNHSILKEVTDSVF